MARDEESGEEAHCPVCGSTAGCPHLLASFDLSFASCAAGYAEKRFGEFETAIAAAFKPRLKSGQQDADWGDDDLHALWQYADESWTAECEDVEVDWDALFRLLMTIFDEVGAIQAEGDLYEGDTPGYSSSMAEFYADDPEETFNRALALLTEMLARDP